jgi:hypothetical protein
MPRHTPLSIALIHMQDHERQGNDLIATSPTQALVEYTTAIELFLQIASNNKAPSVQRTRCRAACELLFTKAESLKRQISTQPSLKLQQQPIQLDKPSIKEETILLKSSRINGGKYPPLKAGTQPVIVESSEPFT